LASAITEKFKAAVPVFFGLCRRLRISRIDRVYSLASSLLFSLLYGAEFVTKTDVIAQCEVLWWRGVRAFYGLPNGVSNCTLALLFPQFSLVNRVLQAKVSLSLRGLRRTATIFPEAVVYDRGVLFESHRRGFVQSIREWGCAFELPAIFLEPDKGVAIGLLEARREEALDAAWASFSAMSSTRAVAELLGGRANFHRASLEASRFTKLGLRVFLLIVTGSLAQSYSKNRVCSQCGVPFTFVHFLDCPALGSDVYLTLRGFVEREDFERFVICLLSRFQVFIHFFRGGQLSRDEDDMFDLLDDCVGNKDQTPAQSF
jgi:hypothetical protein